MKNISRRERLVLLALAVWVFGAVVYSSCRLFAGESCPGTSGRRNS